MIQTCVFRDKSSFPIFQIFCNQLQKKFVHDLWCGCSSTKDFSFFLNFFFDFSIKMFRKIFKGVSITLTTIVGTGSLYFLHQNDYELSSIGAIRFARAGITVSFIFIY